MNSFCVLGRFFANVFWRPLCTGSHESGVVWLVLLQRTCLQNPLEVDIGSKPTSFLRYKTVQKHFLSKIVEDKTGKIIDYF